MVFGQPDGLSRFGYHPVYLAKLFADNLGDNWLAVFRNAPMSIHVTFGVFEQKTMVEKLAHRLHITYLSKYRIKFQPQHVMHSSKIGFLVFDLSIVNLAGLFYPAASQNI